MHSYNLTSLEIHVARAHPLHDHITLQYDPIQYQIRQKANTTEPRNSALNTYSVVVFLV